MPSNMSVTEFEMSVPVRQTLHETCRGQCEFVGCVINPRSAVNVRLILKKSYLIQTPCALSNKCRGKEKAGTQLA